MCMCMYIYIYIYILAKYNYYDYIIYRCSCVTIHGTNYKPRCWLFIGIKRFETCTLPEFGLLIKILMVEHNDEISNLKLVLLKKLKHIDFAEEYMVT